MLGPCAVRSSDCSSCWRSSWWPTPRWHPRWARCRSRSGNRRARPSPSSGARSSHRRLSRRTPSVKPSAASPTSSALHATAGRSASRLRSSRDVRTSGTTSRAPFSRGTSGGRSRADRLTQQELLGGGQAGAEPHGHAEVLQRHLDSREPAEQVEVVEAPEMADAEHLATDRAQPDAEGQVEPSMGVADELVGVRSEEHTSELQSRFDLVCRLLLEKKKTNRQVTYK